MKRTQEFAAFNMNQFASDTKGKKLFPHIPITRGNKREKTDLGELSIAEFNYGMFQVIKYNEPHLQAAIRNHLEQVNEDAMTWRWEDVRLW